MIFADPLDPLHGPPVKNLWSKRIKVLTWSVWQSRRDFDDQVGVEESGRRNRFLVGGSRLEVNVAFLAGTQTRFVGKKFESEKILVNTVTTAKESSLSDVKQFLTPPFPYYHFFGNNKLIWCRQKSLIPSLYCRDVIYWRPVSLKEYAKVIPITDRTYRRTYKIWF